MRGAKGQNYLPIGKGGREEKNENSFVIMIWESKLSKTITRNLFFFYPQHSVRKENETQTNRHTIECKKGNGRWEEVIKIVVYRRNNKTCIFKNLEEETGDEGRGGGV